MTSAQVLHAIDELAAKVGDTMLPGVIAIARDVASTWPDPTNATNKYGRLVQLGGALQDAGLREPMAAAAAVYRATHRKEPDDVLHILLGLVEGGELLRALDLRLAALTELRRACSQPAPRPVAPAAASA
jgi:hypothetical protein